MEVYLVGGAVRDELLGRPVKERDWVIVGGTASDMLGAGYRQVGRDFPVFLHPETSEEYALARTERKTGPGHQGFAVHADPSVTLEEDLARRDLTINAMARSSEGRLIDPFGGQTDLAAKTLRHVSPAFEEDPLRVFRVARFAAQLPDFHVAQATLRLMETMARRGALSELSAERVWGELLKAVRAPAPDRFITVLRECHALSPWLEAFSGAEPGKTGDLADPSHRFAAFTSNLDEEDLVSLCERLKAPKAYGRLALWVVRFRSALGRWQAADLEAVYRALSERGAFRPDGDLDTALDVIESLEAVDLDALRQTVSRIRAEVKPERLQSQGLSGKALGEALEGARLGALAAARGSNSSC